MSNTISPIKPVLVRDSVVNFRDAQHKFAAVYDGGSQSTWQKFPSTSYSQSSINFNVNLPSMRTCVDRRIYLSMEAEVTITPLNDAGVPTPKPDIIRAGYEAFRAYPINSVVETMSCQIQNNNVSVSASDVYPYLLRYHNNDKLRNGYLSLSPHEMDQSQNYEELAGATRNPLGGVQDAALGGPIGRGGFPYTSFINSTNLAPAKLTAILTENVLISPFIHTDDEAGIMGINQMNFVFNLKSSLKRMWSRVGGIGYNASVDVKINNPQLLMRFITVKQLAQIPRQLVYNYNNIDKYNIDEQGTIIPNGVKTVISQNIQFNSIPDMIYIFVRRANKELTELTTDTFFAIDKVSIEFNNVSGIMSNATPEELYMTSVSNGVNIPYEQWRGVAYSLRAINKISGVGSILAINPAKDFGFDDSNTNGVKNKSTFQVSVDCRNLSQFDTITPSLYVISVSAGAMIITDNNVTLYQGILSQNDVLQAGEQKGIDAKQLREDKYGGSFLDVLKDVGKFVKDNKLVSRGLDIGASLAPHPGAKAAFALGADVARKLGAGKKKGGAVMSRNELRQLLE